MRPYVVAAALVAALAPVPASAAENTCLIRVSPTSTFGWLTGVDATMTCASSFPGMAITVCLESLTPQVETVGWATESCDTTAAWAGATTVWGSTAACVDSVGLVRGRAYAVDQYGREVAGWGPPAEGGRISCEPL